MARFQDHRDPKLFNAKVGDIILLEDTVSELRLPCMVCEFPSEPMGSRRSYGKMGLYDNQNTLFLVEVETGRARKMPHLSSRVEIIDGDRIVISIADKEGQS